MHSPVDTDSSSSEPASTESSRPLCPAPLDAALAAGLPWLDAALLVPRGVPDPIDEIDLEHRRHVGVSAGMYGSAPYFESFPWLGDPTTAAAYLRWARQAVLSKPRSSPESYRAQMELLDRIRDAWAELHFFGEAFPPRLLDEEMAIATLLQEVVAYVGPSREACIQPPSGIAS